MSDIDPMRPTQTTPSQEEKLVIYRKKNPISHLNRIKNPCFAMSVHSSGPIGL